MTAMGELDPGTMAKAEKALAGFSLRAFRHEGMSILALTYHARSEVHRDAGYSRNAKLFRRRLSKTVRHVRILSESGDGSPVLASLEAPSRSDIDEESAFMRACVEEVRLRPISKAGLVPSLAFFCGGLGHRKGLERILSEAVLGACMPIEPQRPWDDAEWASLKERTTDLARSMASRYAENIAPSLASAGFSNAFIDAMQALRLRGDATLDIVSLLFGQGPAASHARRFSVDYPYLAESFWEDVLLCASMDEQPTPGLLLPGMPAPKLRRLTGLRADDLGETVERPRCTSVMALVEAMPVDWWPVEPEGFRSLGRMADVLDHAVRRLGLRLPDLIASVGGDWQGFEQRCLDQVQAVVPRLERSGRLTEAVNDTTDVIRDMGERIMLPLLARSITEPGSLVEDAHGIRGRAAVLARKAALEGKSLPAVLEVSARWHRALPRINALMPVGSSLDGSWETPFEEFIHGKVAIVPVTDFASLSEEGAPGPDRNGALGLSHCVASYRRAAQDGEIHILSVRRPLANGSYERLSTVEAAVGSDGVLTVRQHRGRANGEPCREALDAVRALREQVLAQPSAPARRSDDPVQRSCGYDWTDERLMNQALVAYAPGLPRWMRRLDAQGAMEELGLVAAARPSMVA